MKKKTVLATILLSALTASITASLNAQEIEILEDTVATEASAPQATANNAEPIVYQDPIGVNKVKFSPDGLTILSIMSTGEAELLIGDQQDTRMATKKAELRAKASIAKFMSETINTVEALGEMTDTITSTTSPTDKSVTRDTVEKMTEGITNSANALLKGVVTLKQDVDRDNKIVIVTVGISENTLKAATSLKQTIEAPVNAPQKVKVEQNIKSEGRDVRVSKMMDEF